MEFDISSASNSEAGHDKSRHWLRARRDGSLAIRGAELSAVSPDLGFAEEFGIADELADYLNGWSGYTAIISYFLNDDANYNALETVYGQNGGSASNRTSRRTMDNVLERDFDEMVALSILTGRVFKTHPIEFAESSSRSEQGLIGNLKELKQSTVRVEAKRKSLFAALKPTPEREDLHQRLDGLNERIARTYKPILKTETKIISDLESQIRGNPPKAKRLLDNFLQANESDAVGDRFFVSFLATQHAIAQSESVLAQAAEIVKSAAQKGSIAADFIKERIDDNGGDNQMRFMADILKERGGQIPFVNNMAARFETWPMDLSGSYETFRAQYIAKLTTSIQRVSGQNINKMWIHPTLDMLEAAIDRVARRFKIKYVQGTKLLKEGTSVKIGGSAVLSTSDVIPSLSHEEEHVPLKPAVLKIGIDEQRLIWNQAVNAAEIASKLVPNKQRNDKQFIEEVELIIGRLTTQPFGEGTHLLRGQTGKTKFYSINPKHTNLPVRRTKDARVIYTVSGGNLGVYTVHADHDEYELAVAGLLKARL